MIVYGDSFCLFILFDSLAESIIRNSWASPLPDATPTIRELILFKGSYIARLYV